MCCSETTKLSARALVASVFASCVFGSSVFAPLAQSPIKIAFYNIRSGKGSQPLRGHPAAFAETDNCTDKKQPLNAWGAGATQRELAQLAADSAVVALGLAEAWNCAKP